MSGKIITISRQFGSGGHEVGKKLAERLGLNCYDKELVDAIAKEGRFEQGFVEANDEQFTTPTYPLISGFALSLFYQHSPSDVVFKEQAKMMLRIADKGPCVVVGRCADFVLSPFNPLKVFIYGSTEKRIERKFAMVPEGVELTREDIRERIEEVDKKREEYPEMYADGKWGLTEAYDLCINTDKCGIDGAVDTICAYLESCK